MEYKGIHTTTSNAITDVDAKSGIVKGYFSVFGNIDSDNDIMVKGAFTKTLQENQRRIKHLFQHDITKPLSGTKNGNLKVWQDEKGLAFESKISETSYGRDAIKLHEDGVIDELSVGFQTIKAFDKKSYREIVEVRLWEGSSVTWGANEMAQTKSMTSEQICVKMDNVLKSIRNGKFENEDLFDSLEFYFKQLQSQINTLAVKEAQVPKDNDSNGLIDAINFYNKL